METWLLVLTVLRYCSLALDLPFLVGRKKWKIKSFPGFSCAPMCIRISHEEIHYNALSKCDDYELTKCQRGSRGLSFRVIEQRM